MLKHSKGMNLELLTNGFLGRDIMNGSVNRIKKISKNKTLIPLFTLQLCGILLIGCVGAAVLQPLPVYAANPVTTTIGALITSILLQSGSANIDSNYLNYINTNETMTTQLTYDPGNITSLPEGLGSQIETALNNAPASVTRTIADQATSTADIVYLRDYITQSGGDAMQLPSMTSATAAQNITASAENFVQTGEVSQSFAGLNTAGFGAILPTFLNFLNGQRNSNIRNLELAQLAADGKITQAEFENAIYGDGTLLEQKNKTIVNGLDINTSNSYMQYFAPNVRNVFFILRQSSTYEYVGNLGTNIIPYTYVNGQYRYFMLVNLGNTTSFTRYQNGVGTNTTIGGGSSEFSFGQGLTTQITNYGGFYNFANKSDALTAVNNWKNGQNIPSVESPSLLGKDGQLSGTTTTDPTTNLTLYNINSSPSYNYNNYTMAPVDPAAYTQFANQANNAIQNGASQESIGAMFTQFLQPYLTQREAVVPTQTPIYPSVVPPQPTSGPLPTMTPEQEAEIPKGMVPADIIHKFPFSIPWDVVYAIKHFGTDDRNAPVLDADIDLGPGGEHHIHIDFSDYDNVAILLRSLELLLFIVLLARATKHLMWS